MKLHIETKVTSSHMTMVYYICVGTCLSKFVEFDYNNVSVAFIFEET